MKSTDRNLHGVSSRILAHAITHSKLSGNFQKRLSGRYRPESVTLSRGVGAPARPPTASRLAGRLARRSHRPLLWITAAWLGLLQVVMVILIYQDIITRGPRLRMKKQELRTSEDQVDAGTRRCLARSAQLTGRRQGGQRSGSLSNQSHSSRLRNPGLSGLSLRQLLLRSPKGIKDVIGSH